MSIAQELVRRAWARKTPAPPPDSFARRFVEWAQAGAPREEPPAAVMEPYQPTTFEQVAGVVGYPFDRAEDALGYERGTLNPLNLQHGPLAAAAQALNAPNQLLGGFVRAPGVITRSLGEGESLGQALSEATEPAQLEEPLSTMVARTVVPEVAPPGPDSGILHKAAYYGGGVARFLVDLAGAAALDPFAAPGVAIGAPGRVARIAAQEAAEAGVRQGLAEGLRDTFRTTARAGAPELHQEARTAEEALAPTLPRTAENPLGGTAEPLSPGELGPALRYMESVRVRAQDVARRRALQEQRAAEEAARGRPPAPASAAPEPTPPLETPAPVEAPAVPAQVAQGEAAAPALKEPPVSPPEALETLRAPEVASAPAPTPSWAPKGPQRPPSPSLQPGSTVRTPAGQSYTVAQGEPRFVLGEWQVPVERPGGKVAYVAAPGQAVRAPREPRLPAGSQTNVQQAAPAAALLPPTPAGISRPSAAPPRAPRPTPRLTQAAESALAEAPAQAPAAAAPLHAAAAARPLHAAAPAAPISSLPAPAPPWLPPARRSLVQHLVEMVRKPFREARGDVAQVKSQQQVVREMTRAFQTKLRFGPGKGMVGRHAPPGRFWERPDLAEVKEAADSSVAFHELGHALNAHFSLSTLLAREPVVRRELETLGRAGRGSATAGASPVTLEKEGLAELLRRYVEEPGSLNATPRAREAFEKWLRENPDLGRVILQARQDLELRRTAPAQALVEAEIVSTPERAGRTLADVAEMVADDLAPIKAASERLEKAAGKRLAPTDNLYTLARLFRGVPEYLELMLGKRTSRGKWEGGQLELVKDPATGRLRAQVKSGTRPLNAILDEVGEDPRTARGFRRYLVARRAQELHGRGLRTPFEAGVVDQTVKELERDHPEFKRIVKEVYAWEDSILEYLVQSGMVSKEGAARIRKMNEAYVPWHRLFEGGVDALPETARGGGRGLLVSTPEQLRRIKGSGRQIVDPIESMVRNLHAAVMQAEKNRLGQTLARLWDEQRPAIGHIVREVEEPRQFFNARLDELLSGRRLEHELRSLGIDVEDFGLDSADMRALVEMFPEVKLGRKSSLLPWGKNMVRVKDGDAWRFFEVTDDGFYRAWTALDHEEVTWWASHLGKLAALKRAGVTRELGFIMRNMLRDPVTNAVVSHRVPLLPFETLARGLSLYWTREGKNLLEQMGLSGGSLAMRTNLYSEAGWRQAVHQAMRGMSPQARALTWLPEPLARGWKGSSKVLGQLHDGLIRLSEWSEEVNRLGVYAKALKHYEGKGLKGADLLAQAAFESRDVMDFALRGTLTRNVKRVVPFFQPSITGTYRFWEALKEDPRGTLLRGAAYVGLPTVALYMLNRGDDDYWQLPQQERDLFWHIRVGAGPENFLRLPKPFLEGHFFGTMAERVLQWADKEDPEAFKDILQETLEALAPVRMSKGFGSDLRLIPVPNLGPFGDLAVQAVTGVDLFGQRPIEPVWMDLAHMPVHLRATDYTTATAKWLAQGPLKGVMSPLHIDKALYTLLGSQGLNVTRGVVDPALETLGLAERGVTRPRSALEHMGLAKKTGRSESEDRFYTALEHLRQKKAANKEAGESYTPEEAARLKEMEAVARQLRDLHKELRATTDPGRREELVREVRRLTSRFTPAVGRKR